MDRGESIHVRGDKGGVALRSEFSKVTIFRAIIGCGIIQVLMAMMSQWMSASAVIELSWGVEAICYFMMSAYIIWQSTYRLKTFKKDIEGLQNKELLLCVLLVFMTQYFMSVGGYQVVLSILFYTNERLAIQVYEEPLLRFSSQQDLLFACITVSILVPIFEEFLFRGVILSRFMNWFSMIGALAIMALCFGFLHGVDFIGATIFGFLCGMLYLKFENIWAPILVHLLNNALTCLSFSLRQEVHPSLAALTQSYIDHQFKEGLVLLSVGMILLFFTIKRLNLVRLE